MSNPRKFLITHVNTPLFSRRCHRVIEVIIQNEKPVLLVTEFSGHYRWNLIKNSNGTIEQIHPADWLQTVYTEQPKEVVNEFLDWLEKNGMKNIYRRGESREQDGIS